MKILFFSMVGGSSLLNQFVSRESTVTFLLVVRVVKDKFIKSLTIYTGYYSLYSFCFYFLCQGCGPGCPGTCSVNQVGLLGECSSSLSSPACDESLIWFLIVVHAQAYSHWLPLEGLLEGLHGDLKVKC